MKKVKVEDRIGSKQVDTAHGGISRRSFLQGGAVFAGIASLSALGLTGCSSSNPTDNASSGSQANISDIQCEIYDTDILVVGGGVAASLAACQAAKEGHVVMMVDKGPFKYSGAAGLNWDCGILTLGVPVPSADAYDAPWLDMATEMYKAEPETIELFNAPYPDMLSNKNITSNVIDFMGTNPDAWNLPLMFTRMGNTGWPRDAEGSWPKGPDGELLPVVPEGVYFRHCPAYVQEFTNINVMDNTMVTDIVVSDGKCVGVMGLDKNTGTYRVIRANATIVATGGSTQMYGWTGTSSMSINSPDNTGDVDVAAYRHGCSLIDTEFFTYDLINVAPEAFAGSFCSGIGADSMGVKLICNNKGEHFMEHLLTKMTGYVPITHFVAEEIAKGGGSENGAVYIDLTAPDAHLYERPTYFRNVELWKKELGIDVMEPGHLVEIGIEAFEHLGQPAVDDKMMSTELPGLFNVRGAGNSVMIHSNHWFAPYTGHCACEYASSNSDIGEIDLSGVKSEIERLQSILNAEGTKRPHEIRHAIQHAFYEAMYAGTDAEKLQKAIDELERIKTEDLPEMYVSNKSLVWNSEWKQAIENYNILELAEASLKATLMREESRIFFYRHDFPEPDDENWLAHIKVKQVDGKMEFEKVPVVQ